MRATPLRPERLVARTRRLDDDTDILAVLGAGDFGWWHDDRGLVASGVARRVPVGRVRDVLCAIDAVGEAGAPGPAPIAVGALPFDRTAHAELVVPARLWRRDGQGRTWVTHVSVGSGEDRPPAPEHVVVPDHVGVPGGTSEEEWTRAVGTVLRGIEAGELDKVVLSRQVAVLADHEFSVTDVVRRLRADQPGCYVFAAGGFVGASPELLVERRGRVVRSRPMAGTTRNPDRTAAWLSESAKNRREHAMVVDAVVRALDGVCSEPVRASQPYAERFADLAHIVTDVVGTLASDELSALDLALALHPTPAIAGTPTDAALGLIGALETRSRHRYGGPVGWVDAAGDGEFAVALRCAEVHGDRAVLYAGAGIVAGSTAEDEWQETETKLEPMRRALAGR